MRVKGDLQATRTPANVPAAKQFYDQSLVFARERKAMSLELQASLGLAKLLLKQGQQKEARDLLAPICSWFTEGFDTPDLKEAKALLDG
jgi:predicted ATPase